MRQRKYKQWMCVCGIGLVQLLSACEPANMPKLEVSAEAAKFEHGLSLTQATRPVAEGAISPHLDHVLSPAEEFWIGSYSAVIPCSDPFAGCEQGYLTYIVHFSADGYSYRNMLIAGQINVEAPKRERHVPRKDQWSLSSDQQHLIAHLKEGIDIFWKIKADDSIEMDLAAIRLYNLPEQYDAFFKYRPFPKQAIILKRNLNQAIKKST